MKHTTFAAQARIETPLGPATLAATDAGLAGFWFDDQRHHPGELDAPPDPAHPRIAAAVAELAAYWNGEGTGFATPLDPRGTPFQRAVWDALRAVPPGTTTSYAEIARRVGRPSAVRAVGAAIGRNPLCVVVPCHRIIGSGGALTGYAGGLDRKRALLDLERRAAAAAAGAVPAVEHGAGTKAGARTATGAATAPGTGSRSAAGTGSAPAGPEPGLARSLDREPASPRPDPARPAAPAATDATAAPGGRVR